jgi:hypothetical protein
MGSATEQKYFGAENTSARFRKRIETQRVVGEYVPSSDMVLRALLGLSDLPPFSDEVTMRVAIENQSGKIYRIIGVADFVHFLQVMEFLEKRHYLIKPLRFALHAGFDGVVQVPQPVAL